MWIKEIFLLAAVPLTLDCSCNLQGLFLYSLLLANKRSKSPVGAKLHSVVRKGYGNTEYEQIRKPRRGGIVQHFSLLL